MTYSVKSPRKLIEVALPLDAINAACAREKSIRHGHPSTLHLWWARRPLAAARAVIFAQLVNDPGYQQGSGFKYGRNKKEAAIERARLFKVIEDLVLWENTTNDEVLARAQAEIRRSWREVCALNKDHPQASELFNPERPPAFHDPFAGGGTIPLEAQRLGLEACASDLNPVAVLINKAMIEIPPRFAGIQPVGTAPERRHQTTIPRTWPGTSGLAEDVRCYGAWMRAEALRRIGHLYPKAEVTAEMARERPDLAPLVGQQLTVIAWLWARTVKSPSPAFRHVDVPLASTFILASKEGKDAYVHPVVDGGEYRFTVRMGTPPSTAKEGTKSTGRGATFRCIVSGAPMDGEYIKSEAIAGRMAEKLMAVVAEGNRRRIYLSPTKEMEDIAREAAPAWKPDVPFFQQALGFRVGNYGMTKWSDLFTARQLAALTTFSDLVVEVRERVRKDALAAGMSDLEQGLAGGGTGARAYAEAVSVYLAFAVDRSADFWCNLCIWANQPKNELVGHMFSRQAISMAWDFGENNPFSDSGGNFTKNLDYVVRGIEFLPSHGTSAVFQSDAAEIGGLDPQLGARSLSTDPPYYDNIGYADLSDFFYVWLRPALRAVFPQLLATIATPKAEELVATPARHGGREKAERFFLENMTKTMRVLASLSHPDGPITIFYAFKQADTSEAVGTSSTGWETFLEAVCRAGLQLTGTWPMRTEREGRMRGNASNALASSIILVCRKRSADAPTVSRRDFLRELNAALPEALDEMTKGSGGDRSPVAPVDLSQAIIGPGMAVFSRYSAVLEADGSPMSVLTALQLINRFLAEDDFDPDTQFCLRWFEQNGWKSGKFGEADTLSRAKGTSVEGVKTAGVVESGGGSVRLLKWSEYDPDWDPKTDTRNPVWETLHHLIRALKRDGESGAGHLLSAVANKGEAARQLAYRLYVLCERQGWAEDARAYNELITSWSGIESAAGAPSAETVQGKLFD